MGIVPDTINLVCPLHLGNLQISDRTGDHTVLIKTLYEVRCDPSLSGRIVMWLIPGSLERPWSGETGFWCKECDFALNRTLQKQTPVQTESAPSALRVHTYLGPFVYVASTTWNGLLGSIYQKPSHVLYKASSGYCIPISGLAWLPSTGYCTQDLGITSQKEESQVLPLFTPLHGPPHKATLGSRV